ncbi:transposase, partial [Enterococcus cecorum]
MSKYSYEFKKQVVNAYLNGEGGYTYLANKFGIPSDNKVKLWVDNYNAFGDEGLKRSRKKDFYSFEKKLSIVELYLSSEISYQDLALQEGITNPS